MIYYLLFRKQKIRSESGQTLILMLLFMIVAVMITTAAVFMTLVNSQAADKVYQGTSAYDIAESGAETAMLKLLRDPEYIGETLPINSGQAVITVTGTNPQTITSVGTSGNFKRTIQVSVSTTNNTLTVVSWKEIH